MSGSITDSQFYMWRAVFAMVHADNVVTTEEIRFMAEVLEDVPFSSDQRAILEEDAKHAQSVDAMFEGITDPADQSEFFDIARRVVNIDGDYAEEEQKVLIRLQTMHTLDVNVDDLVGSVDLELEDMGAHGTRKTLENRPKSLYSFRDRFLQKLRGE